MAAKPRATSSQLSGGNCAKGTGQHAGRQGTAARRPAPASTILRRRAQGRRRSPSTLRGAQTIAQALRLRRLQAAGPGAPVANRIATRPDRSIHRRWGRTGPVESRASVQRAKLRCRSEISSGPIHSTAGRDGPALRRVAAAIQSAHRSRRTSTNGPLLVSVARNWNPDCRTDLPH